MINCPSHQKWASANINGKPLFWTFSESDQMSHCFFWLRKTVKDSLRSLSLSEHIAIICAYWEYNLTRALSRQCPAISLLSLYPNLFRRPPLTCGDPVSKSIPNDWLLTINEGNSSLMMHVNYEIQYPILWCCVMLCNTAICNMDPRLFGVQFLRTNPEADASLPQPNWRCDQSCRASDQWTWLRYLHGSTPPVSDFRLVSTCLRAWHHFKLSAQTVNHLRSSWRSLVSPARQSSRENAAEFNHFGQSMAANVSYVYVYI